MASETFQQTTKSVDFFVIIAVRVKSPFVISVHERNICFNERFDNKEGGSGSDKFFGGYTLEDCQDECLDTAECLSLSYLSQTSHCLIFYREIPLDDLSDLPGGVHINKKCTGI